MCYANVNVLQSCQKHGTLGFTKDRMYVLHSAQLALQ
jgi:hypothetical protein